MVEEARHHLNDYKDPEKMPLDEKKVKHKRNPTSELQSRQLRRCLRTQRSKGWDTLTMGHWV